MKRILSLSLLSLSLTAVLPAGAQEAPVAAPAPPPPARDAAASRARFSAGRFVVESLVGLVVGSAAAYGTLRGVCGDEICIGGALAGLGANMVATPLAVSLTGWGMGGQGTFGYAMLGEVLGVGAGASVTSVSPAAALGIGLTLGPFASAGMFEARSHREASSIALGPARVMPYASPTVTPQGTLGGALGLAGHF